MDAFPEDFGVGSDGQSGSSTGRSFCALRLGRATGGAPEVPGSNATNATLYAANLPALVLTKAEPGQSVEAGGNPDPAAGSVAPGSRVGALISEGGSRQDCPACSSARRSSEAPAPPLTEPALFNQTRACPAHCLGARKLAAG